MRGGVKSQFTQLGRVQPLMPPVPGKPAISVWMQSACEICGLGGSEIVGEQVQAVVVARQLSPELGEPLMLQLADSFGS